MKSYTRLIQVRKRTGIILLSLLAVALIVAAFFLRKEKQVIVADPWVAIPSDAFFIIETGDFPELMTSITDPAGMMSRLSEMKWASSVVHEASVVDSITGSRDVRELISNRKVLISLHVTRQGHVTPLIVMDCGAMIKTKKLASLFVQSGAIIGDRRELGGTGTLTVIYGRGNKQMPVYAALTSGIMILSPSESLVSAALENKNTGSDIRHQQGFMPVVSASGKDADNIFVLFRNLPGFVRSFIKADEIASVSSVAVAGGGDLSLSEEGLFISGFLSTSGTGTGADHISDIPPVECSVHELLPAGTLSYITIMKRAALKGETVNDPASINATDLALILSPYTGMEVTEAIVRVNGEEQAVSVFRMTDRQSGEDVLRKRLAARYKSMGMVEKNFIVSEKGYGGDEITLYKMPFSGVSSILAGEGKTEAEDEWVMFARSYMIFSGSPEALLMIKSESDDDNTMINDPEFREMEKTMPSKSSYQFYASGSVLRSLLDKILLPDDAASLTGNALRCIGGIGLSMTPSNNMIYTSISMRYNNDAEKAEAGMTETVTTGRTISDTSSDGELKLLWKVKLDAEPAIKPFLFTNHNTGATEIFIQDRKNNIYLISASGKILWKASIREQITGDIYMIDYYKNNKLQLLCTGKDYIHLIDRNGNYVDKYPVKMKVPASNTLAVFDYEKNKEYRLCIAGEDKKIYIYDRSGSPVKGWNLFTTRGKVTDPVAFFRVRGKDYLFAADDQAVYVLDRTGSIRVAHQEPLKKASGSTARLVSGNEPAIIFSDPEGTVIRLLFDGTVKKEVVSTFSAGYHSDFADIDGNGSTDYVFLDHDMLSAYDSRGDVIYSYKFKTDQLTGPYIFGTGPDEKGTAVYENSRRMLNLITAKGTQVSGFPVVAGPYYTIGRIVNKNRWNLLVNKNDSFLYNYELVSGL